MPKTIGDYFDNVVIDLKNYERQADHVEKTMRKLRMYGHQMNDSFQQFVKILKERGVYDKIRKMEQL